MRRKGKPKKQKSPKEVKVPVKRGRPRKTIETNENDPPLKKKRGRPKTVKVEQDALDSNDDPLRLARDHSQASIPNVSIAPDETYSEGLHMSTMQVRALSSLVACLDCGEEVVLGVRPTTKGMISEFTVTCKVCESQKSTNTPNLIRERKRKREKKGVVLQKNENINYAHVAAFLDNGLGYSGLRHYCKYLNARCLNEATFIVYAKQVISDVVAETEDFLQQNARIVRKAFESQLDSDFTLDLTVGYTTTYHQWGSDFCLVAGAVIDLQTGLVLDYDVGNMYCHVCKINAKKIVSMSPAEMTEWFNKHQDTCEIREWCDEIDQDSEEGIKEIDPKYLEAFIAKKIWARSLIKFGFRYTTLIHESDERIHAELLKAAPYGDIPVLIDNITNCFSRRKSEHARTSFQNKLKAKCPRERVQTKDRIMYVYAMSIPEYNKFAIGSNIKLRELVRRMEMEEEEEYEYTTELTIQASEILPSGQTSELTEEKSAALKEIGDAFEVEKDPDGEEEETQDDPDEEEGIGDEDEQEEEEYEDEEMQDEELVNPRNIEVLEDEEMDSTVKDVLSAKSSQADNEENISHEQADAITLKVEPHVSIVNQPLHAKASSSEPRVDSELSKTGSYGNKKGPNTVTSAQRTLILTGRNRPMSEYSRVKEMPSTSGIYFEGSMREEKPIHLAEDGTVSIEKIPASSEPKKIIVMAGKKGEIGSDSKSTASLSLKRPLMMDSHKEERVEVTPRETHKTPGTEVRKVITNDKVRVVVVERQDMSENLPRVSSGPSNITSKNKEIGQSKVPSENGMEGTKVRQFKQREVKPFRVDFDDDS